MAEAATCREEAAATTAGTTPSSWEEGVEKVQVQEEVQGLEEGQGQVHEGQSAAAPSTLHASPTGSRASRDVLTT